MKSSLQSTASWTCRAAACGIALVMLAIYALLASRAPCFGDTPELMAASVRLGVAHPTGYPLLTLLGKAASLVPAGPVAYRLNLVVAIVGASACGILCLLLCRVLGNWTAAAVVALAFGLSPVMWHNCTNFEVYSLDALFLIATLHLAVETWGHDPAGVVVRTRCFRMLALVVGLGVSHHLTYVAILPAVAWVWLSQRRRWRPGRSDLLAALAMLAAGLLPWLYLPIRGRFPFDPYSCWASLDTVSATFAHMTASQYGGLMLAWSPPAMPLLLRRDLGALWEQFGLLLAFAPLGLALLRSPARPVVQAALVLTAVSMGLFFGYAVGDYEVFYIPAYVGLAILIAGGIAWLGQRLAGARSRGLAVLPAFAALAILAGHLPSRYADRPAVDQEACMDSVDRLLAETSPDGVLLLSAQWRDIDSRLFPILYAKATDGRARDLDCLNAAELPRPPMRDAFLERVQASPALRLAVAEAADEQKTATFLRGYDGRRPLYVNAPRVLAQAGLGGELNGFTWRVTRRPGFTLGPAAASALSWAEHQLELSRQSEEVQCNVAGIFLNHAYYFLLNDQPERAVAAARRMARLLPRSDVALFHAAGILSRCGDPGGAAQVCGDMKRLTPYSAHAYVLDALLLENRGRYREALRACDLARSVDRVNSDADVRYLRGLCYIGLGDMTRAERAAGPDVWPQLLQRMYAPQR